MEFVGDVLGNSDGVAWYYIAGLLIFLVLFIVVVYRTVTMKKGDINRYKESILDNNEITESN